MSKRLLAPCLAGLLAAAGCHNTPPSASFGSPPAPPRVPAVRDRVPPAPQAGEPPPKAAPAKKAESKEKGEFKTGEREIPG
jgi:hypothetical protein